jgi:hypothetical protein
MVRKLTNVRIPHLIVELDTPVIVLRATPSSPLVCPVPKCGRTFLLVAEVQSHINVAHYDLLAANQTHSASLPIPHYSLHGPSQSPDLPAITPSNINTHIPFESPILGFLSSPLNESTPQNNYALRKRPLEDPFLPAPTRIRSEIQFNGPPVVLAPNTSSESEIAPFDSPPTPTPITQKATLLRLADSRRKPASSPIHSFHGKNSLSLAPSPLQNELVLDLPEEEEVQSGSNSEQLLGLPGNQELLTNRQSTPPDPTLSKTDNLQDEATCSDDEDVAMTQATQTSDELFSTPLVNIGITGYDADVDEAGSLYNGNVTASEMNRGNR